MQINSNLQTGYTGTVKTGATKEKEPQREMVTLGQKSDDLQLMPDLKNMKSGDINPMAIYAMIGAVSAGGAAIAGLGWAGKAIGGFPGALIATGVSAAGVGLLFKGNDSAKGFAKGAIMGGTMAATGALLGPWGMLAGAAEPVGFMVLNEKTGF